jgi:amidase
LQPYEALQTFQAWIDRANPRFQFSVARNLAFASLTPASERTYAGLVRQEAQGRMRQLVPPGTILCLPTTPFPAPRCGQPLSVLEPLRDRITALCCHGGLTGVPQVTIPGTTVDGRPVGLSIVGMPGSDAMLVALARVLSL